MLMMFNPAMKLLWEYFKTQREMLIKGWILIVKT